MLAYSIEKPGGKAVRRSHAFGRIASDEREENSVQRKARTLVVGLGEVGGALAAVLERAAPVLRHDIERRDFAEPIGVMHLCLPFGSGERFEEIALSYIERFKPELTIINCTVTPGTTRTIERCSGRPVAFSPVRGKHVRMVDDLLRYKKFIAAVDPATAVRAQEHFRQAGMRTQLVAQPETLELAKLAETTYFGLIIAFAQELNRYAAAARADYDEAASFFDEVDYLPRTRYFPGVIGGHCVIPNLRLMLRVAPSALLEAVLDSNRRRAEELRGGVTASKAVAQRS
jgi:UDP-glucose/GDP-mannose dehydrogenase family protein